VSSAENAEGGVHHLTRGVGGFVVLPLRMPLRSFSEEEAEQEIRERERSGRWEVSSPRENQIAWSMPHAVGRASR
jgi:hypothetical protein